MNPAGEEPKLTCLGKLVIAALIMGCFVGAGYYFLMGKTAPGSTSNASNRTDPGGGSFSTPSTPQNGSANPTPPSTPGTRVEFGLAYGSEKKRWLEAAVIDFAKTPEGQNIKVNLISMGSLQAAQAIVGGDKRIQAWSPASNLYKDVFITEWQVKYPNPPIIKEETVALTPMVYVFWDERYKAFEAKYHAINFATIGQALQEKTGWDGIAQKADWGFFKFGHTHPNKSNSGLMTLVLMAHEFHKKDRGLEMKDILNPVFQDWMQGVERGVAGLSDSSGDMMKEMVLKGPSAYDGMFTYESVVIDYLKNAQGRWGDLKVVYPEKNMWNDHPYYILDAEWSTPDQRKAAQVFLEYLMSEPLQKRSLEHGFRPGNPAVPIKFEESPFVLYQKNGLKVDLNTTCQPPKADVINNLLGSWQRAQGNR